MCDRESAKRLLNSTRRCKTGTVIVVAWRWPGIRGIIRVRKKREKRKGGRGGWGKGEMTWHAAQMRCSAQFRTHLRACCTSRDTTCVHVQRVPGPPARSLRWSSLISLSASTAELRTWPSVDALCLEVVDSRSRLY